MRSGKGAAGRRGAASAGPSRYPGIRPIPRKAPLAGSRGYRFPAPTIPGSYGPLFPGGNKTPRRSPPESGAGPEMPVVLRGGETAGARCASGVPGAVRACRSRFPPPRACAEFGARHHHEDLRPQEGKQLSGYTPTARPSHRGNGDFAPSVPRHGVLPAGLAGTRGGGQATGRCPATRRKLRCRSPRGRAEPSETPRSSRENVRGSAFPGGVRRGRRAQFRRCDHENCNTNAIVRRTNCTWKGSSPSRSLRGVPGPEW